MLELVVVFVYLTTSLISAGYWMNTFQKPVYIVIMYFILKTKYTLSLKFVLSHVRGNNHWSTSQVRLKSLNYRRTLK
jgi:hypothetical protein